MKAPGYAWRCYRCDEVNAPDTGMCVACGGPAFMNGVELAKAMAIERGRGDEEVRARSGSPALGAEAEESIGTQSAKLALCLLAMAVLMVASYLYPYPDGHRPSFWSFVLLWGREAIILLFYFLVFLLVLVVWVWNRLERTLVKFFPAMSRRVDDKGESAPSR